MCSARMMMESTTTTSSSSASSASSAVSSPRAKRDKKQRRKKGSKHQHEHEPHDGEAQAPVAAGEVVADRNRSSSSSAANIVEDRAPTNGGDSVVGCSVSAGGEVTIKVTSPKKKRKKGKEASATASAAAATGEPETMVSNSTTTSSSTTTTTLTPTAMGGSSSDTTEAASSSSSSVATARKEGAQSMPSRNKSDATLNDFDEVLEPAEEEGLTDEQVYIAKVLRGIRKGALYGESLFKQKQDEKELEKTKEEDREPAAMEGFIRRDYKDKATFKFHSPTPADSRIPLFKKDKVVVMTDYAPRIFHHIRAKCNVSTNDYLKAWTYSKDCLPSPNLGAGRSGSLFLCSADCRFIFKTIPEHEVETLIEILPAIHKHFVEHPGSRIIRFLGLHHFHDTATKEETHCIVMNNLLHHPSFSTIDEKWDLKGRIPKPGKEGRFATTVDRSKKVLKDNDLLDRRFYLTEDAREELLKTLYDDVEFLKTHNCMDYSLLVGVHFIKESEVEVAEREREKLKEDKKRKKGKKGKKKGKKAAEEKERGAEGGPALFEGVMVPIHSNPAFKKEVYFIGIIDPLSRYKLRKKVAHFLKEIIWDDDTLSTVRDSVLCPCALH